VPSVFLEEMIWLALAVIVAGGVSGILAGLFGIGGGAVIVPALYEVFRILDVPEDVRMQLCIGTSLAIMVPTSVRSYLAHRSKGAVITGVVLMWSLSAVIGFLWSENGASLVEAATRNCLWDIPDTCVGAIYSKPAMSSAGW
jgi:uncharacterized membrane protein YfcA